MLEKLPDPLRRSRTPSESSASSSSSSDEEEELLRARREGSANSEASTNDRRNPIEANAVIKKSIPAETVNASTDEDDSDYDDIDGGGVKKKRKDSKEAEVECLYNQEFRTLHDECIANGTLFEDPEFPPDNDLLRLRSKRIEDDVEWMRPSEYLELAKDLDEDTPILVSERNEGFDIKNTLDSWFVPAMGAIAESESLLRRVVPDDQGFNPEDPDAQKRYAGIFHFRFWFGRWIEIVIDDRLPIRKSSPIYMRSASSVEMWPSLLEKAYAKAKGSYELLNRWMPIDGCIELTGGVPERVRNLPMFLSEEQTHSGTHASDRLFFDLIRASQMGNIILVSLPSSSSLKPEEGQPPNRRTPEQAALKARLAEASQLGLETRYVYRVTQVANLGQGRQIIRVKNCSGPKQIKWIGAWHTQDTRWANVSDSIRRELDSETFHDGGFWMAYGDFLKYFQTLDICHISSADVDQDVTFHGRWEVGLNAGGVQKGDFKSFAKNPQCFVRLTDGDPHDPEGRCAAIISLMQRRQPQSRAKGTNKIGFKVYRVDSTTEELNAPYFSYKRNDGGHKCLAKTPTWQDGRETNVRVRLPRGKYCIIPSTFQPDQEGDFILRVHIERYSREEVKEELRQLEMEDPQPSNVDSTYNLSTGSGIGKRKGSRESASTPGPSSSFPVPQPRSSRA